MATQPTKPLRRIKYPFYLRLMRWGWRRVLFNIRHLRGEPHEIAMGGAIGMFIAVTPTFGFQLLLAVFVASIFKANRIAALGLVWVTNVFTVIPVYYYVCKVGKFIIGGRIRYEHLEKVDWKSLHSVWMFMYHNLVALTIGSIVVGTITGAIIYIILFRMATYYRSLRAKKIQERNSFSSKESK